ncbi:MAG TPA: hypothetical protein VLW84_11885 [Terriglobales bacterium]|nr:hypothetical protein [Terriglobales bacterium]
MRSFLRMAGISQKISPDEVFPLLARNVYAQGYQGWQTKGGRTEFLILLSRYVQQSRELAALAGPEGVIRISGCEQAQPLLRVIGYRVRQECGQTNTSLVTADPDRAFLTIDSGFPLLALEETLQGRRPFSHPFPTAHSPALFTENDWVNASREGLKGSRDLLDALLNDPVLARLYWAMYRMDPDTREILKRSVGLGPLLPFAATLDFYGSQICIRSGAVVVPGGSQAENAWKDLVGVSPRSPSEFVLHLLAKDKGWLVAYFDALSRVSQAQQARFTQGHRLQQFYEAFRTPEPSVDAARAAFRPAPGLLLLLTRIQWDSQGQPYVPGNLEMWKAIFRENYDSKALHQWGKRAGHWNNPEQLVEGLLAASRVYSDAGPLQIYLMLSELDAGRSTDKHLSPQTAILLAHNFARFGNQYLLFSEFPALNDASITRFVNVADVLDRIPNHVLRGNAMGIFQANVGLWQILARQGQIHSSDLNNSWQQLVAPFLKVSSNGQLFDAGQVSLQALMAAATGKATVSQDQIIDVLAGPHQISPEGQRMHREMTGRIRSVLDGQRLVSLDTIFVLGNGLTAMARGEAVGDSLLPFAGELREFEMPRPIFSSGERSEWAAGIYNNRHTELQMHTDLTKLIKSGGSHGQFEEARGQLAPFLRDTVVGLNYAYYEPPGAQMLHNNPLFVRSHDFSGDTVVGIQRVWATPQLFGQGSPAGGGAHLVGSLAGLPYVLSEVEEDFITPENVQALIWRDMVPGLLTSAIVSRWWTVAPEELHAVTLYQRTGEELLAASVGDEKLRAQVMEILSERMTPKRAEQVEQALRSGHLPEIMPRLMPADTFYLASEFRQKYPEQATSLGPASQELEALSRRHPADVSWERLSQDFGVPHPILAQSYSRELLNVKPFPAYEGYSSRLLAESWDSNNLYWARLADEMGYSPVELNRLVPELTRRMVEKIFATEFEDWPAVLRAMQETGEEFRQGKVALAGGPAPGGAVSAQP